MDMPLIDRDPSRSETEMLKLFLSFFSNGMGWETEANQRTRIGWRQIERIISYFYTGEMHKEDKDIFDVVCPTWDSPDRRIGLSIKSKELKGRNQIFGGFASDTRLYLELSNSHAKFWDELGSIGLTTADFNVKENAQEMGDAVVSLVSKWHAKRFADDVSLIRDRSRYLVVSYGGFHEETQSRKCAIHTYSLTLPPAIWSFQSKRCLHGTCAQTGQHLYDWYGLSGGQLKYYPKAESALHKTDIFTLLQADSTPFIELVEEQFGCQQELLCNLTKRQRELLGRD